MNALACAVHVRVTNAIWRRARAIARDTSGASVIEYAILLGVIVGAVTVAVGTFGDNISQAITGIAGRVTTTVSTVGST